MRNFELKINQPPFFCPLGAEQICKIWTDLQDFCPKGALLFPRSGEFAIRPS
jgi:hypothetical protein